MKVLCDDGVSPVTTLEATFANLNGKSFTVRPGNNALLIGTVYTVTVQDDNGTVVQPARKMTLQNYIWQGTQPSGNPLAVTADECDFTVN